MYMKKILIITLLLILALPSLNCYAETNDIRVPKITSRYAVVMDYDSGRVLYEKGSNKIVPMASTTKIMTAIIALENSKLDDIVTVSKKSASIHGSVVGLKQGQKVTMEELLYGLMLRSGNDCAIAIAEHIGGSVEGFLKMMNTKAFDLGAYNTHFSTPHGLDADGHFTTAYELALITRYAFANNEFLKIVSTKEVKLNGANGTKTYHNINRLLWMLEGADGVKTGYTGKAGRCLVSSASRNGKRVICVVLNSPSRWEDSKKLIEYGFNNYKNSVTLNSNDYMKSIKIDGGSKRNLTIGFDNSITIPISQDEKDNLDFQLDIEENLTAPIYKDQQVGRLKIYFNSREIYSIPYKSMESIKAS